MITSAPFPPREGIGYYIWNLSKYLTSRGHRVHIVTRSEVGRANNETVDDIIIWRPTFVPVYPFHVHLHSLFVEKLIMRLEPEIDLFHMHTPLPPMISTKRPIMLTVHSAVREDVKATPITSVYTLQMKLQAPFSYWIEQTLLRHATSVNAVSPQVAQALATYPSGPSKIDVTWNGVDTSTFRPGSTTSSHKCLILSVGRLAPGKGIEDLLQAVLTMKHLGTPAEAIQLSIVGDGPQRQYIEQFIHANQLSERVVLLGHINDRTRLARLYQEATLFVMPSHHEGLPTVILEAMACGCPIVATKVGGVPNIVVNGENGALVPPHAPTQLAHTLLELIQQPALLAAMRLRSRQMVETFFSWDTVGDNYAARYKELV